MKELRKALKKSNKGFSLVELIVVICIMAVLTGIIATAFVKYVGQSKETADQANLDELHKAANTVLADPTFEAFTGSTAKLTIKDGKPINDIEGNFQELLEASLGKDKNGDPSYPTPQEKGKCFVITITKSDDGGYSAAVELGDASATTAPTK